MTYRLDRTCIHTRLFSANSLSLSLSLSVLSSWAWVWHFCMKPGRVSVEPGECLFLKSATKLTRQLVACQTASLSVSCFGWFWLTHAWLLTWHGTLSTKSQVAFLLICILFKLQKKGKKGKKKIISLSWKWLVDDRFKATFPPPRLSFLCCFHIDFKTRSEVFCVPNWCFPQMKRLDFSNMPH